ncbi:acetate--CoA ligase family protein [Patescibacteria group bacterium]
MNVRPLFYPKSIAVIGASENRKKLGNVIFRNCLSFGYAGQVFPINLSAKSVEGHRAYQRVKDVPIRPDLAIIATPAKTIPAVMSEIARAGIPAVSIISAGFRELGSQGALLEEKVISVAEKAGIALLGPNCLGFVMPYHKLNASFAEGMPDEGGVSIVSQSGAMAVAIADWASGSGLGFHSLISLGNKAIINERDVLQFLQNDQKVRVVMMYLEDVRDGREFLSDVSKIARRLPVIILKAGRTQAAAEAVASHTGALVSTGKVTVAALQSAGCLVVDTIEELFGLARAFAYAKKPKGSNIAIVTNAGGPGILATDAVGREKLTIAKFSKKTHTALRNSLPRAAAIGNPIDVVGDATPQRFETALRHAVADVNVDAVCAILTHQLVTDTIGIAKRIEKVQKKTSKPVYAAFIGGKGVKKGITYLRSKDIPTFAYPEEAIHALSEAFKWKHLQPVAPARVPKSHKKLISKDGSILGDAALRILEKYGMTAPPGVTVRTKEAAVLAAEKLGFPVVMKVVSQKALHKTDAKGIVIDVHSKAAAASTATDFIKRFGKTFKTPTDGILIQPHIQEALEVFVGGVHVPDFGPMIVIGLGGIFVESLNEVTYHPAPITLDQAKALLKKSQLWPIIKGTRGKNFAIAKLEKTIVAMSNFISRHPEVSTVDCNPVMLTSKHAWAVDARIVMNEI